MKRTLIIFLFINGVLSVQAQSLKSILKKAVSQDSSKNKIVSGIGGVFSQGSTLNTAEVVSGLKEALNKGVSTATTKLSAPDGFFKDAAIKILLPPEAAKIESTLRRAGMGKLADDAILSINRAAEDAAGQAAPIFLTAIKQMNVNDAMGILRGSDTAATNYLRVRTASSLTEAFKPAITQSLAKVNATKYWQSMMAAYNKIPMVKKVNPDLSAYVTSRAVDGIFFQIGAEETSIRKDPQARTSELLKKVFGGK